MPEPLLTSWQAPKFESSPQIRKAWIEEQIQEGEGWLATQRAYKDIASNLQMFDAVFKDKSRSDLVTNGLKYDIRKFVEIISDVREIGTYSSDAKQFKPYAEMINKVASGVYLESAFPRSVRKTLQYSTVLGRGYIWPKCKTENYGWGERKIIFKPLGPLDVVPVQIPDTNDVQGAYNVTAYEYMPIAEAHGRFPLFQALLKPVSDMSFDSRVQARRADYAQKLMVGDSSRNWGNLYSEIRYTWIRDLRVNDTGKEMPMGDFNEQGEPVTSWSYKVPFVGQSIRAGFQNGQMQMRPARPEDCLVYPYLRLIITNREIEIPMYDGPAFDCTGVIPLVQYDVDDWAWEGMGRSLVSDVAAIEKTKRRLERKMDQTIQTTLNPPMGYNRAETGGPKMENFDVFAENMRMGVDGEPKKVIQSILPEEIQVRTEHFKFWEMLRDMRREQLGINDLGNLENLKFSISSGDIDKALEPIGPIAKGIAAGMEAANAKVAYILKFLIPQYYDTARVISIIGPDNVTQEVFDFDPKSIVPSHMPDEYVADQPPTTPSNYPAVERMRRLAKNIRLVSVPSTLLKLTQKDEQLKWMTLKKQGAPISWATTLKKLGIENYGEVKGDTEREKWINEQIEELKLKAMAAQMAAELGIGGGEPGPGQGKGGGRPNSNKKPPKNYSKGQDGGTPRTGVKTS